MHGEGVANTVSIFSKKHKRLSNMLIISKNSQEFLKTPRDSAARLANALAL